MEGVRVAEMVVTPEFDNALYDDSQCFVSPSSHETGDGSSQGWCLTRTKSSSDPVTSFHTVRPLEVEKNDTEFNNFTAGAEAQRNVTTKLHDASAHGNSSQGEDLEVDLLADRLASLAQDLDVSDTRSENAKHPGRVIEPDVDSCTEFEDPGPIEDVNQTVGYWSQAVSRTPDDNVNKPSLLHNLGFSLLCRFQSLGDPVDLDDAINCGEKAVSLTVGEDPNIQKIINNLGNWLYARFVRLGKLRDLEHAIKCGERAILLTPDDHEDKPTVLNNLGSQYLARFWCSNELTDLNKAIEYVAEAVSLTSNDHMDIIARLSNLGSSYLSRFERLGELPDLNKAIECGSKANSLAPDTYPDKAIILCNLGVTYRARFGILDDFLDLNRAIECGEEALIFSPPSYTGKASQLNNLGNSYQSRFQRLGELPDLNKAIEYQVASAALIPDDHPQKPLVLSNLGNSFLERFERLGEPEDLDKSIAHGVKAVSMTPDKHVSKPVLLSGLGNAYSIRFKTRGELADLQKYIECGAKAALLTPDDHVLKPGRLSNLGGSYTTRFETLGQRSDLDESIEIGVKAVSMTPDGHSLKPVLLSNLGRAYNLRFIHSQNPPDVEASTECFRAAAQTSSGSPGVRFKACRMWAQLASRYDISTPYRAYHRALELVSRVVWVGTTLDRRYSLAEDVGGIATEAASYAIGTGKYNFALEWLEVGRSIIWGQISQLRTSFDRLTSRHPVLARRLEEVGRKLEDVGSRPSPVSSIASGSDDKSWDKELNTHIQLALDWDQLLNETRSITGFEDFLCPPKASRLLGAVHSHPVAIINLHESRCDALILIPNQHTIFHVPLGQFSTKDAITAHGCFVQLSRHRKPGHLNTLGSFEMAMASLWLGVVKPVLDFLGYTEKLPIERLPRITWCTTGALSFLPLHAAGLFNQPEPNAFNFVVSSYTPSLGALLVNKPEIRSAQCGILAVGQAKTPGLESLPCVEEELQMIGKYAQSGVYLQLEDEEATVNQVLDAMDQFSWVHMACHGSQDAGDPTQSAFHLHDGGLTLASISKRSFRNKGLAFLSACQTAAGHKDLPDESVHLAAGMHLAGYPSVIATMWSIADEDGPLIANLVYAELLEDDNMDYTRAARALHQAVAHLRAKLGEESFGRWAPFIHIGS